MSGSNGEHDWIICRACQKFTLEVNQYGMCHKCSNGDRAPAPIMFASIMFHVAPISESSSRVLSERKWRKIVKQVDEFYKHIPESHQGLWNTKVTRQKRRLRKPDPREGYIYLIKAETGYYKLGRSYDVEVRLSQHEMDYPMELRVLHSFQSSDVVHDERRILDAFKPKQLRGEWFELDGYDVEWIKSIEDYSLSSAFLKFKDRQRLFKPEKPTLENKPIRGISGQIRKVARRVRALWG